MRGLPRGWVAVVFVLCGILLGGGRVAAETVAPPLAQEARHGWELFLAKGCIRCHTIFGQGEGVIGPDLGRIHLSHLSQAELATNIINHLPKMWEKMQEQGLGYPTMEEEEMESLFSFLYFIRYVDEPGDPVAGRALLATKRCIACHSLQGEGGKVGPDLSRWGAYINPIVWAQRMWQHAPGMEAAMQSQGIAWPRLNGRDMANLVAYAQSLGGRVQPEHHLDLGSPARGEGLFVAKRCSACHPVGGGRRGVGPNFLTVKFPRTLAGMATLMWNHAPQMAAMMARRHIPKEEITPQEMADILSYLFALRYRDPPGDPARGRQTFEAKRCPLCHVAREGAEGGEVGPDLSRLGDLTTTRITHAIWNHGPKMIEKMHDYGFTWPVLHGSELSDIVAYLRGGGDDGSGALEK